MEVSWAWLIIGLVAGTALGLMVMGALAERKVQEAQSRVDPVNYNRAYWEGHGDGLSQLGWERAQWKANEQKWVTTTLDLSKEVERLKATIEKLNPSNFSNSCPVCSPEVERTLAAVDLGQKGA